MTHTYRVVVTREGHDGFTGASGVYRTHGQAWLELRDIARTWIGLADPRWFDKFTAFTVQPDDLPAQTYSILQESESTK